jgi:hypothetical protein
MAAGEFGDGRGKLSVDSNPFGTPGYLKKHLTFSLYSGKIQL